MLEISYSWLAVAHWACHIYDFSHSIPLNSNQPI